MTRQLYDCSNATPSLARVENERVNLLGPVWLLLPSWTALLAPHFSGLDDLVCPRVLFAFPLSLPSYPTPKS